MEPRRIEPGRTTSGIPFRKRFGLLFLGLFVLGINHLFVVFDQRAFMKLVLVGALVVGVGICAAISPEHLRVIRGRPQPGDGRRQVEVLLVMLASVALAFWLWVYYYRAEDAEALRQFIAGH